MTCPTFHDRQMGHTTRPNLRPGQRSRQPRPELSDDDWERVLQIIDHTYPEDVHALGDFLDDFQRRHGDQGLLIFIDELRRCLRRTRALDDEDEIGDEPPAPLTKTEELQLLERENQDRLSTWYRRRLAIRVVCPKCGRVRHGRRWVHADLAEGEPSVRGVCPDCEAKGYTI